jgi:hypothetical protein
MLKRTRSVLSSLRAAHQELRGIANDMAAEQAAATLEARRNGKSGVGPGTTVPTVVNGMAAGVERVLPHMLDVATKIAEGMAKPSPARDGEKDKAKDRDGDADAPPVDEG